MSDANKKTITAHCIVKNDERFVGYALRSVVEYVDKILVFDTGSTDRTVKVIQEVVSQYPDKIYFEQKGEQDKISHTHLRQEMLEKTVTEWFMALDGDEIWTTRGIEEVISEIQKPNAPAWMIAPYYLCVGDVFHTYYKEKYEPWYRRVGFYTPRIVRMSSDLVWRGDYELDTLYYKSTGKHVYTNESESDLFFLKNKFWHLTHLRRSSDDDKVFTSGLCKTRAEKRRPTYFLIGRKIKEPIPEVLQNSPGGKKMGRIESFMRFCWLMISKPILLYRWIYLILFKK